MSPVPIHSDKPIAPTAAKADGITPRTANEASSDLPPPTTTTASSNAAPATSSGPWPGQPAMPAPTGTADAKMPILNPTQPTRTTGISTHNGPPAPQPGPVPVPPSTSARTSQIPPPPQPVQRVFHQQQQPSQTPTESSQIPPPVTSPPPQLSMAPPADPSLYKPTHSTSAQPLFQPPAHPSTTVLATLPTSLDHPPGYQQNPNADAMSAEQRAAQGLAAGSGPMSLAEGAGFGGSAAGENALDSSSGDAVTLEGAWDAAKQWAGGVATKVGELEEEVWRRVNQGS